MFDTIAAVSSGNINQPISIIRISGPDSFAIANTIFTGKTGTDKTVTYGFIKDHDQMIDEVLVSWFKGPNTFTGEDIVEINAHGGVVVTQKILKLILRHGARLAERGEFSRRAFLNGKIDLIKAEAIHDLIFAKTEEQAQLSVKKFDGQTSKMIDELKDKLLHIIATIETNIDYPEYDDVEVMTQEVLEPKLKKVISDLNEILNSSRSSRYIYEGVNVAIVGRPNAGKSSLLNALINEEKAIVTNIPGTTRDVVEGQMQINQVLLNFKDTAGIHTTGDEVEQIGISKSLEQINNADLVIHLIDGSIGELEDDIKIEKASQGKIYFKVFNKSDIKGHEGISISAKEKEITQLIDAIKDSFKDINLDDSKIVYNTRQLSLIEKSLSASEEALKALESGMQPDEVIVDIRLAWDHLANILGKADQDDLLDTMFKSFCLGK